MLIISASQVYPRAERERVVGTDSSSLSSLSDVEVVVRLRLADLESLAVEEAFFLGEGAGAAAFELGLLPPLMALEVDEGPFKDCRPAVLLLVVFLGEAEAALRFFAEADVSSSATSSESEGLLLSSSFSSSSSSSVLSLLLRRAGAAFSSVVSCGSVGGNQTTRRRAGTHRHSTQSRL